MKIRKAVIPAAGLGTRLLPATKATPKEMLPLADKPSIQYIVEEAVASGIEHVIVITSRTKRIIEDHFDSSPELERMLEQKGDYKTLEMLRQIEDMAQVTFTRQPSPRGLGHAILQAKDLVGDEPFGVMLPDDLIDTNGDTPCLRQLMDVYEQHEGSVLAVMHVPRDQVNRYGIIAGEPMAPRAWRVSETVEKPAVERAPSDLAIVGRYVLTPEIFELLERTQPGSGGEVQVTDAIDALLGLQSVFAYEFTGTRYDMGDKLGWLTTSVAYALKRPDLAPSIKAFLRGLNLD
ncbi:MAG TPA: UTP--glucose-1-phosphate uridylyltransferase GalU [Ktedonobacterales bacterium]|nr:UTP--glucose-1-phosphate uridylyltransferase GalU [Ktedonobacterales bacterium]